MDRLIRVAVAVSCCSGAACFAGGEDGAAVDTPRGVVGAEILARDAPGAEILVGEAAGAEILARDTAGAASEASVSPPVWVECPPFPNLPDVGQECATISVPLDYRTPHGRQIDLAISRVRTGQPGLRRGVLLLNPGGPGAEGLDLAPVFALVLPPEARDQYDLIGFDPRGAGRSSPISCELTGARSRAGEPPDGFEASVETAGTIADLCGAAEGDVLPFMTSNNTVRDMDRIRRALREERISYWGVSGGTNLGSMYASLFPGRTDRFVLDSSIDPGARWREVFRFAGPGGEIRFPDLAAFMAAHDPTYHLGATPLEVRNLFEQLIASLNASPIILSDGTPFDGEFLRGLTFSGLYHDIRFPFTAQLWQKVHESPDDAAGLEELLRTAENVPSPGVPADNFESLYFANVCGDVEWSRSVGQYRAEYDADRTLYPLFGSLGSNIGPCAFWPVTPIEPLVQVSSRGPTGILMVQNLRDPITPHLEAIRMRAALGDRARMISVDQGGHGVLVGQNACGIDATFAFLASGVLPVDDRFCPREPPPDASRADTARDQALQELRRRLAPMRLPGLETPAL